MQAQPMYKMIRKQILTSDTSPCIFELIHPETISPMPGEKKLSEKCVVVLDGNYKFSGDITPYSGTEGYINVYVNGIKSVSSNVVSSGQRVIVTTPPIKLKEGDEVAFSVVASTKAGKIILLANTLKAYGISESISLEQIF